MNKLLYTVLVVDGDVFDITDPYTSCIKYDSLTGNEVKELTEKSLKQGYAIVIWQQEDSECGET